MPPVAIANTLHFCEASPVSMIDTFVGALNLGELGFAGIDTKATDCPSYHPSILLKLYVYGYLNAVQSSRRLEREAGRNVELMWLLGRLVLDHKTIADFCKDNGASIKKVCAQFIELYRTLGLLAKTSVAIDGSKFKAVNNRDRNFTKNKVKRRRAQLEESIDRYLRQLDSTDRQEPTLANQMKTLPKVATEMALHVLAYSLIRVVNMIGIKPLIAAIRDSFALFIWKSGSDGHFGEV